MTNKTKLRIGVYGAFALLGLAASTQQAEAWGSWQPSAWAAKGTNAQCSDVDDCTGTAWLSSDGKTLYAESPSCVVQVQGRGKPTINGSYPVTPTAWGDEFNQGQTVSLQVSQALTHSQCRCQWVPC